MTYGEKATCAASCSGVEDRFDGADSRIVAQGELDGSVNGPDLPGSLGLGDGGERLVGSLRQVLNQKNALGIIRYRLREMLPMFEEGNLDWARGDLDDHMRQGASSPESPATVALKGLKQASMAVAICGTLGRSLAALAATSSGLSTDS